MEWNQRTNLCLRVKCCLSERGVLLPAVGSAYPAIKSGYEIFQIATDDIPSKIVFAGYRFLFAGILLLLLALAQRNRLAG